MFRRFKRSCATAAIASRRPNSTMVAPPLRPKVTVVELAKKKKHGEKVSMVTAYTYPSAVHVDSAGIDIILVGDSVAMVELGFDTTLPVTLDQMLYHCKAVSRGAKNAFLVGDMPFGTYETDINAAYHNAIRFLKEGNMDCVKLEGGKNRAETVRALVQGGVAVMGHIGLTPQSYSIVGGFRAQGKTVDAAMSLIDDAVALEHAGCCALVVECVPPEVGKAITEAVKIPTIGIGAGPSTDGQVLVYHDLLGMMEHEHYKKASPKFMKKYAKLGEEIHSALVKYREEVASGAFPSTDYSPYKMVGEESELFQKALKERKTQQPQSNPKSEKINTDTDNKIEKLY